MLENNLDAYSAAAAAAALHAEHLSNTGGFRTPALTLSHNRCDTVKENKSNLYLRDDGGWFCRRR